jgi:hypothetical protein
MLRDQAASLQGLVEVFRVSDDDGRGADGEGAVEPAEMTLPA